MKSFDTDIKKYADKIRLKASERRELRERVFAYMEYHPLTKQPVATKELKDESIVSESFITLHFNALYARIAGGVLILLLVVMPFFAEYSVPGDVLYLVKTEVNESIQAQFASSPYEKIEFETKLMERRISEARVLATEGKLTEEVKTRIAETVKGHTEVVQQELSTLRKEDAEGAALATIAFNSSLEVQSAMIEATVSSATDTAPMDSILMAVNDAHEENILQREDATPSYESIIGKVELETTRAYELFITAKEGATEEEIADIDRRITDINRLTDEARERSKSDRERSITDLTTVLGLTQKLIAFMTDIDVRETVALENLVPVILSDEERITIVNGEIETLGTVLKEEVTARLEYLEDAAFREKIETGLVSVDDLLLKASQALEAHDIGLGESSVKEARAIMTDIDVMTQYLDENIEPTEGNEDVPVETPEENATSTENVVDENATSSTVSIEEESITGA